MLSFLLLLQLLLFALADELGCDAPKPKPIDFSTKQSARFYKNGGEGLMADNITPLHFDLLDYSGVTNIPDLIQVAARGLKLANGEYWLSTANGRRVDRPSLFLKSSSPYFLVIPEKDKFVWPPLAVGHKVQLQNHCVGPDSKVLEIETLAIRPKLFRIRNFITDAECDYIVAEAGPKVAQSLVAEKGQEATAHPGRTSHHTWLRNTDLAVSALADRMATCIAMVPDSPYAEELQVVRYLNGQFYHSHTDFFNPEYMVDPPAHVLDGWNRLSTALMYLTDVEEGGETLFPRADDFNAGFDYNMSNCDYGLKVIPHKRDMVLFYSLLAEGQRKAQEGVYDHQSLHAGCAVTKGTKWVANKWYHNRQSVEVDY